MAPGHAWDKVQLLKIGLLTSTISFLAIPLLSQLSSSAQSHAPYFGFIELFIIPKTCLASSSFKAFQYFHWKTSLFVYRTSSHFLLCYTIQLITKPRTFTYVLTYFSPWPCELKRHLPHSFTDEKAEAHQK